MFILSFPWWHFLFRGVVVYLFLILLLRLTGKRQVGQLAPFDLVLLLDLSGSTSDKIGLIRKSAKRFVDAARPADRIAIFTFTSDIQVVSKLTNDHKALKKSIDYIEKPFGGTNFWDALRFVLELIGAQSRVENRRSAVVVMTDGVDNALPGVYGEGSATSFVIAPTAGLASGPISASAIVACRRTSGRSSSSALMSAGTAVWA